MKRLLLLLSCSLISLGAVSAGNGSFSLDGTWKTDCLSASAGARSMTVQFLFKGNSAEYTLKMYEGQNCLHALYSYEIESTYVQGPVTTQNSPRKLDIDLARLQLTVLDSALIANVNETKHCGYTDWKIGTAKVVGRTLCGSNEYYDPNTRLYQLHTVTDNIFRFGKTDAAHDALSEATRPVEVSAVAYVKESTTP